MLKELVWIEELDREYTLWIGKNARENEEIIRMSNGDSLWFHLENISGPHMILETEGEPIPKRYINMVASKFRLHKKGLGKNYRVIYTEVKNVGLTNVLGSVTTKNTRTIKI